MQKVKSINRSSKKIRKSGNKKEIKIDCFENNHDQILFSQSSLMIEDLLQFIRNRNNNYVTVQICDEDGDFFIIDRNSENIFEKTKEMMKKTSLFELMTPISIEYMNDNIENQTVLRKDQESNIFSYIVYSNNARRKILKHLNTGINSKKKTMNQKEKLINSYRNRLEKEQLLQSLNEDNNISSENNDNSIDLYYKYMKYLTTRMTVCQFHIDKNTLQNLIQQNLVIVNSNSKIYKQIINGKFEHHLAVLETQENSEQPQFDFTIMKKDPKIQKYQKKLDQKLKQLQCDVKLEYQSSKDSQECITDHILQNYFEN